VTIHQLQVSTPHPLSSSSIDPASLLEAARIEVPEVTDEMSDAQLLATLRDKRSGIFLDVVRHVLFDVEFNSSLLSRHSCAPTSVVTFPNLERSTPPSAAAKTVSFLSEAELEEDVDVRSVLLAFRGLTLGCDCERCAVERAGIGAFGAETLWRLIEQAKEQERYLDAISICEQMCEENPTDARVLFERARLEGYSGDFEERERQLKAAARMGLENGGDIQEAVDEFEAYFREEEATREEKKKDTRAKELPVFRIAEGFEKKQEEEAEGGGEEEEEEEEEQRVFVAESCLDKSECKMMIDLSEQYLAGKWTTTRHYAVPTTDVPVCAIPELLKWYNAKLEEVIFPLLHAQFGIDAEATRLRVFDSFLVKYDADGGQKRLPLHNDQSSYSLTIALNDSEEYGGEGGTFFMESGRVEKTEAGGIVSFDGNCEHSGESISRGKRYIIAAFVFSEEIRKQEEEEEEGEDEEEGLLL